MLRYIKDRGPIRKVTNRPRVGMLRVKQLSNLEQEEDLGIPTRFAERHIKGYNNTAIKRYFFVDRSYILIKLYRKWYNQRGNDEQEDFCIQLDKKAILDQAMLERQLGYIKGALIIILRDLEEQAKDQRETIKVLVLVNNIVIFRSSRERFKLKDKNKLRVNLKHLAHYMLVYIAYIDNICDIYKALKQKNYKYLTRMYWALDKRRFRNTKFIYSQYLVEVQELGDLIL